MYREGCCSQFDTLYGMPIGGKVITHKMGTTVLRCTYRRLNTSALEDQNWDRGMGGQTDIEGHAPACRRARKDNPK